MGVVVFLNGASSSGKTSLARALQLKWKTPLLRFGIDDVISQMPFKYTGDEAEAEKGFLVRSKSAATEFVPGSWGCRLNEFAAGYVGEIAGSEFDIVVDYVLTEALLAPFVTALSSHKVLFCGVFCAASELAAREKRRGDRAPGLAERQSQMVHFCREHYDLELDTTHSISDVLAEQLLDYLATTELQPGLLR